MKSAERYRSLCKQQTESHPETGGVSYRSGVYKMHTVRMIEISDELANVRVYKRYCIEMYRLSLNSDSEEK